MYCLSLLVNAKMMEDFDTILNDIAMCLNCKYQNPEMMKCFDKIWKKIDKLHPSQTADVDPPEGKDHHNQRCVNVSEDMETNVSASKMESPLHRYYNNLVTNLRGRAEEIADNSERNKLNRTYCPAFFSFIEDLLPEMPLWSSVLLGSLDRYSRTPGTSTDDKDSKYMSYLSANNKSEGYVEGAMKQLKQEDFGGLKRLRVDEFVSENYKRIRRRLNHFADKMHINLYKRRKPKRAKDSKEETTKQADEIEEGVYDQISESSGLENPDYNEAEETWSKRSMPTPTKDPKVGQFQQSPAVSLSNTPDPKFTKSKAKHRKITGYLMFLQQNDHELISKYGKKSTARRYAKVAWSKLSDSEKEIYKKMAKKKQPD